MSLIPFAGAVQKFNRDRGYKIERSLRFNSADSAYLNRTPASAGNRQKFTVSVWYKACGIGTSQVNANIINAGGDGSSLLIAGAGAFGATYNDRLLFREAGTTLFYWPMVFRDPSAWYHIVFAMDTTQATAANRAKLYVNGVDQGAFSGTAIGQNTNTSINNTSAHYINTFNGTSYPSSLYYAEYNFIDGQALTPSSFGKFNTDTGVWQPKKYAGEYGTNGFYLDFADNTSTTTLGYDAAGSNDWTLNNFSVTAGVGNDSMVDSPTRYGTDTGAGGEVRGNYCTLNPLNKTSGCTLANGNLNTSATAATNSCVGTMGMSSGKWYYEVTVGTGQQQSIGISTISSMNTADVFSGNYSYGYYGSNGNKYVNGSASAYGATFTGADVIGVAVNIDSNEITFYKNNSSQGTISLQSGQTYFPAHGHYQSSANNCDYNFGARPFQYTAPSGFKALCTQNL